MVVWLCAAPAAAQETLTCGVPLLRTLAPGGTDTYHVTAAPGSVIVIQASSVSPALGPIDMQLSGPGVSNDTCTGIIGPVLIGAAGDFTLKVSQCGGTTGGQYTLALNVVSDDASNCGRLLPCGATPDGTGFSVPGEVDAFQVLLAANQAAVFKANYLAESGAPYLRLYAPNGNEVQPGRCAPTMEFEPAVTGVYTALVSACGVPETLAYRIEFYQPGCPKGPTITHFGITNAMSDPVVPLAQPDPDGRPIYSQRFGEGLSLVVEARAGADGRRAGNSTVPYAAGMEQDPDLQMILSRPLGDGDPTVCDVTPPNLAGVPSTVPFDFTSDPDVLDHIDDMGCRFDNGQGQRLGRPESSEACTRSDQDFGFAFVDRGSAIQYCAQIASAWSFPEGDTIVAARVKDALGNFGQPREIVVRIGDPTPATPTPTVTPSPGPTHTPPPTLPTHTATSTAPRTRTAASPTATPTGPTPTVTSTPTGVPCVGDCSGKGVVSVDDLIRMVNIAVGVAPLEQCPAGDADGDGKIVVGELVQAVNALLNGCPASAGA